MKNLPEMANQFETQIRLLLLQAINKVYAYSYYKHK